MRPERLYLTDIVEAADAIARFLAGANEAEFMHDELRQSAVLQKLIEADSEFTGGDGR